jgi:Spy/CpxP family protein refolding chaperone
MRLRWIVVVGLALVLAGGVPASAQMMGEGSGMTGMMRMMEMMGAAPAPAAGHCPGMTGQPAAFRYEGPWISAALAHAQDLGLSADQVTALTTLREDFAKEATRLVQGIRDAEAALPQLYTQKPTDLTAVEAKIKEIAALQGELRIARVRTLQKGVGLLTDEQRQKLFEGPPGMGRMMGA